MANISINVNLKFKKLKPQQRVSFLYKIKKGGKGTTLVTIRQKSFRPGKK